MEAAVNNISSSSSITIIRIAAGCATQSAARTAVRLAIRSASASRRQKEFRPELQKEKRQGQRNRHRPHHEYWGRFQGDPWWHSAEGAGCDPERAEGASSRHGHRVQWQRQAIHTKFYLWPDGHKECWRDHHRLQW